MAQEPAAHWAATALTEAGCSTTPAEGSEAHTKAWAEYYEKLAQHNVAQQQQQVQQQQQQQQYAQYAAYYGQQQQAYQTPQMQQQMQQHQQAQQQRQQQQQQQMQQQQQQQAAHSAYSFGAAQRQQPAAATAPYNDFQAHYGYSAPSPYAYGSTTQQVGHTVGSGLPSSGGAASGAAPYNTSTVRWGAGCSAGGR